MDAANKSRALLALRVIAAKAAQLADDLEKNRLWAQSAPELHMVLIEMRGTAAAIPPATPRTKT